MNQPSIKKNYAYKLLYEVLIIIAPLITTPYIARVLEPDGVGVYSYTSSVLTYFTMFAALGTVFYGTREIARCRNDKSRYTQIFWEIELLSICTSTICLLCWLVLSLSSHSYRIYFIALTPSLLATMLDISWFYTGLEKVGYTVLLNSICKIAGIICIFIFVKAKTDLTKYIFINSLILLVGNLSMWAFLPKFLANVRTKKLHILKHFKEVLIYFIPTLATSIYMVLDKTLIGLITNDSYQNGYYEEATKIINLTKTGVFTALNSVLSARMSYLFAIGAQEEARVRTEKSLDYILLLGTAASFGILAVAKNFVPTFFGKGYEPVIALLYLMTPLIVIIGISNCIGTHYYTPVGKTKTASYYMVAGSAINLICNICLIPSFGAIGAVIGSIIAETVITILFVYFCNSFITWRTIFTKWYKKLISGVIMLLVITFINNTLRFYGYALLVIQIASGAVVYFLTLVLLQDDSIYSIIQQLHVKGKR